MVATPADRVKADRLKERISEITIALQPSA
jgi:hypothetical protein